MRSLPGGYAIRPASLDDLDGVAEMLLADDLADTGQSDFDADFLRDQWSSPGLDLSVDAWVVTDPRSTIVGHANVASDGDGKFKSWGLVHPDHRARGIGSVLLDRIEARAAERVEPGSGSVFTAVTDVDAAGAALVGTRGFERVRSFRHLQLDLDGPAPEPGGPPPGIEINGIEPERDLVRVHAIFVEAFREEWGYRVIPFEEWSSLEVETTSYDPSLWPSPPTGTRRSERSRASCGATGAGSASSACGSPGVGAGSPRRCSGEPSRRSPRANCPG